MSWMVIIMALSAIISSAGWVIVRCKTSSATERITRQALEGCPPANRANVLRASAQFAGAMNADRVGKKSPTLSLGRKVKRGHG